MARSGGLLHACQRVSMPTMVCSSGVGAACPVQLAHPLGSGRHGQVQGIQGEGLDMVDKEEGRWMIRCTVGVSTCIGMAMSLQKGRGGRVQGVQHGGLNDARNMLGCFAGKMVGLDFNGALDSIWV